MGGGWQLPLEATPTNAIPLHFISFYAPSSNQAKCCVHLASINNCPLSAAAGRAVALTTAKPWLISSMRHAACSMQHEVLQHTPRHTTRMHNGSLSSCLCRCSFTCCSYYYCSCCLLCYILLFFFDAMATGWLVPPPPPSPSPCKTPLFALPTMMDASVCVATLSFAFNYTHTLYLWNRSSIYILKWRPCHFHCRCRCRCCCHCGPLTNTLWRKYVL